MLRRCAPFAVMLLLTGCEDPLPDPRAPRIDEARPAAARAGQTVTLLGRNFGVGGVIDRVWLGGAPVFVESWTDRALLVRVPAERRRGWFDFVVRAGERVGAPFPFEVRAETGDAGGAPDNVRQDAP